MGRVGIRNCEDPLESNAVKSSFRPHSPVLRPRCSIGGKLTGLSGSIGGSLQKEEEKESASKGLLRRCWDSDAGMIATEGLFTTEGVLASEGRFTSAIINRRPSNASAPSPNLSTCSRLKDHTAIQNGERRTAGRVVSIATITADSFSSSDPKHVLPMHHSEQERRSQPDLSTNPATANFSVASAMSNISTTSPTALTTSGLLNSKTNSPCLALHRSFPNIPFSRTPSPSHSSHSLEVGNSPSLIPPSAASLPHSSFGFEFGPPQAEVTTSLPLSTSLLPHQHHKRQRSVSGTADEKLL